MFNVIYYIEFHQINSIMSQADSMEDVTTNGNHSRYEHALLFDVDAIFAIDILEIM